MDSIELAKALPPRQRAALYFSAFMRMAIPTMPWPAWIALCGLAAISAMCGAWIFFAPSLPELGAVRCMEAMALLVPALALDGLLRKIPGIGRSRLPYMAAPILATASFAAWLAFASQPLARMQAISTSAQAKQAAAELLLAEAETNFSGTDSGSRARASEGLSLGLSTAKKLDSQPPKAAALPPIPLPPGVPNPSAPAVSPRDYEAENLETSARLAMGMIEQQSALYTQAAHRIASASAAIRRAPRSEPVPVSAKLAAPAFSAFIAAAAAAWIGGPVLALILSFGIAASAAAPFLAIWSLMAMAGRAASRFARPIVARLIAPGPSELAELHRRVEAYKKMQEPLDAQEASEASEACGPSVHAEPTLGSDATFIPMPTPEFSDLDVIFDFHPEAIPKDSERGIEGGIERMDAALPA